MEINKTVVVVFAVSNLAAMGLELKPREAIKALKNPVFVSLIMVWGWAVGPALAYLLTKIIPLGMCTRNISAVFVAYFGITNPDPGIFVMIVLLIPLTLIVGFGAARVFARQAGGTTMEAAA